MDFFEFLLSTLSNVLATVIGVLIGVPVALHVNDRGERKKKGARHEELRHRVLSSLEIINDAIAYNARILDRSLEKMLTGEVCHFLDLRRTSFQVALPALIEAKLSPGLLQLLSHHWVRLDFFDLLNEKMFVREFGDVHWRDEEQRMTLWTEFYELAIALRSHCDQLGELVAKDVEIWTRRGP